jgi:hypothetical protein
LFPYFVELRESKIKDVGVVPDPKSLIAQRTVNTLGLVSVLDPKVLDPELLVIEKKTVNIYGVVLVPDPKALIITS